jgi:NAD(P)H-hydrate epimerase
MKIVHRPSGNTAGKTIHSSQNRVAEVVSAEMPYLTRAQVREIDRRCIAEFHIPGIILMEHASLGVADAACEELLSLTGKATGNILILCGGGNNGGDGLAVARHLHNRNIAVQIGLTIDPAKYHGDALIQWQIVQAMRLPIFAATPENVRSAKADLIIDAIFGTGLATPPREPFPQFVAAIETTGIPVLAVDLPSGLDCDKGEPLGSAIRAIRTVTFFAEKAGFANYNSREFTGRVTAAGIGAPRELMLSVGTLGN